MQHFESKRVRYGCLCIPEGLGHQDQPDTILSLHFIVMMWFGSLAVMLVPAAAGDESLVGSRSEFRKLAQEGDDIPDVFIVHALAPGWHAAHLDAMLDYPESLARIEHIEFAPLRRLGIQAQAQLGFFHAGPQVTSSAHRVVVPGAQPDVGLVAQIGWWRQRAGTHLDRAIAYHVEDLEGRRPVRLISGNIERTGIDEHGESGDTDSYGNNQSLERLHKYP